MLYFNILLIISVIHVIDIRLQLYLRVKEYSSLFVPSNSIEICSNSSKCESSVSPKLPSEIFLGSSYITSSRDGRRYSGKDCFKNVLKTNIRNSRFFFSWNPQEFLTGNTENDFNISFSDFYRYSHRYKF